MDKYELQDLHTDRTNKCFNTVEAEGEVWDLVQLAKATTLAK